MPAKSKKQLRYAFAHKGEKWAEEIIAKTHTTKGLPERAKGKKSKKGKK